MLHPLEISKIVNCVKLRGMYIMYASIPSLGLCVVNTNFMIVLQKMTQVTSLSS